VSPVDKSTAVCTRLAIAVASAVAARTEADRAMSATLFLPETVWVTEVHREAYGGVTRGFVTEVLREANERHARGEQRHAAQARGVDRMLLEADPAEVVDQ
jgi:hypothetical protein